MKGYPGAYIKSLNNGITLNSGLLSSSPFVRDDFLKLQEQFYLEMEQKGSSPDKITGRYKKVVEIVRDELSEIISDADSFQKLKHEGGGFSDSTIRRVFLTLPKQDERDSVNSLADKWLNDAEGIAEEAQVILDWVKNNTDGPVSVI